MLREIHNIGSDTPERIVMACCPAMRQLGLKVVGISDAGAGYAMQRGKPKEAHVLICHGGRGEVWVDGQPRICEPGMAYLGPVGAPLRYHTVPGQRWEFYWLYYDERRPGDRVPGHAASLVRVDPWPAYHAISGLYRESIGARSVAMLDQWTELLHALVLRALQGTEAFDPLLAVWSAVDADLARPWTLEDLAEIAGVSAETLRRWCLRRTGRSPMDQLAAMRMRRAGVLLTTSTLKIEAVAQAVGYQSRFAFAVAFQRHMQQTPAEFRHHPALESG